MRNPPGFYPFWFWNDRLSEDEIRWQIAQMAAQGIRGFFIHPRQGLQQPYLSEAFFAMVEVAIDAAEQHGLLVHLYDEYPYPSGVAGGEVTEGNPHFHATSLTQRSYDLSSGLIRQTLTRGHILCCMAYPLKDGAICWDRGLDLRSSVGMVLVDQSYNVAGLTQYNQKRNFASNPTPVLETKLDGPYRLFVSAQVHVTTHKYWGYYTDVLNPDAVQHYIDLTHERYYARFGEKFGTSIRSIFVDETQPSWSTLVPDAFREKFAYDLIPLLPALQDDTHPQHTRVAADLNSLLYLMFLDAYDKPMQNWCEKHGIGYSGEKHSMRLSQLKHMHIPGCDPGHTKAGAEELDILVGDIRRSAKATASAAYFYDKEGALDECYHSLGWSGTMQDAKLIAEMLILMDIRYLVPHGFFYSTHALKKHDAPPTFFFQMPYWSLWHHLSARIAALYGHFASTYIPAEILLVDHATVLPTREDMATDGRVRNLLLENQFDFLILDTDILESGRIENGAVHVKDIAAKVVICPPGRFVEEPLEKWLAKFEREGGAVLRVRDEDVADNLLPRILERVRPNLRIRAVAGDLKKLQLVTRTDGARTLYFLINSGGEALCLAFDQTLNEIPIDDLSPLRLCGDECALGPFDSILLEATENALVTRVLPQIVIPVRGEVNVAIKSGNAVRLYDWSMSLLDEKGLLLQTATVPAVPIVNQIAHGNFRIAPDINMRFGTMPDMDMCELRVRYETTIENGYDGRVELLMEPGSVSGEWSLRINDSERILPEAFLPTQSHVRGSLAIDVTPYLKPGSNTLSIDLVTDRPDGGLLNALYLVGDFAVQCDPVVIAARAPTGGFETYEDNGLPFYAGIVEYETRFELDAMPDGDRVLASLDFQDTFLEACEVSVNDSDWRPLPWSPYAFTIAKDHLRTGANTLRIRVYTSLIRSFEGQRFNQHTHSQENIV